MTDAELADIGITRARSLDATEVSPDDPAPRLMAMPMRAGPDGGREVRLNSQAGISRPVSSACRYCPVPFAGKRAKGTFLVPTWKLCSWLHAALNRKAAPLFLETLYRLRSMPRRNWSKHRFHALQYSSRCFLAGLVNIQPK